MQLRHGLHLAYCTNIHRGESWEEVFRNLQTHVLAVRDRICPGQPYAIGLRLGDQAARDLSQPGNLRNFRHWLDQQACYVFTINGFPFGPFHGTRVKEQVYIPDWTHPERLTYTCRLFDLLAQLLPEGMEGSVSTVPGSFKAFIHEEAQVTAMQEQLWRCVDHLDSLHERTGARLHLDLEPEPLCYLETTAEVVRFIEAMRELRPTDGRINRYLRVNYDTCHLAVEFENPHDALACLDGHGIRVGKFHLSSALKVRPSTEALEALASFADPVYLHQVVVRRPGQPLQRFTDLPELLAQKCPTNPEDEEWRIHYHVPLHAQPAPRWDTTADHLTEVLDHLAGNPQICSHLEMETYTWEVLPKELAAQNVVDQLVAEYRWTLDQLDQRNLGPITVPPSDHQPRTQASTDPKPSPCS